MKEFKTRKEIKAMSGGLVLLQQGRVPIIGFIDNHEKSLLPDGRLITSTQVVFDYEEIANYDCFTFYEGILISKAHYGLKDSLFIDRYLIIMRKYKTELYSKPNSLDHGLASFVNNYFFSVPLFLLIRAFTFFGVVFKD